MLKAQFLNALNIVRTQTTVTDFSTAKALFQLERDLPELVDVREPPSPCQPRQYCIAIATEKGLLVLAEAEKAGHRFTKQVS
jgi:hypothetical protein